ncbi:PREDICTED: sulfotransferase 6B1-like [Priapulus caudatus]|uniref:Sulfotransferase 6B1-like n=1 Tax=Priapulus caudatus TaxID=37621 RepID=A0ABM1F948_PRICU|nr:PREDICTED: sulfotransferase 6B1-like [Priapulus caudatus]
MTSNNLVPPLYEGIGTVVRHDGRIKWRQEPEFLRMLQGCDFESRDDDVWIVGYPKSGRQFLHNIVTAILHRADADTFKERTTRPMGSLETGLMMGPRQRIFKVNITPTPRVLICRMRYDEIPASVVARPNKIIYVLRNPKDVAAEYYIHHKTERAFTSTKGRITTPWDDYYEYFLSGDVMGGSLFDLVLDWWRHREEKHIKFVTYEEITKDLAAAVVDLSQFLGVELNEEEIAKVVSLNELPTELSGLKESNADQKGSISTWRQFFTDEQSERFDKLCNERLKDSGVKLPCT